MDIRETISSESVSARTRSHMKKRQQLTSHDTLPAPPRKCARINRRCISASAEVPSSARSRHPHSRSSPRPIPTCINSLKANADTFNSLREISDALQKDGIAQCGLVLGLDFTRCNRKKGKRTFGGKNLHTISDHCQNPYQEIISIFGETLRPLYERIPIYGFGDKIVKGRGILRLSSWSYNYLADFREVLTSYNECALTIKLDGPRNFAPIIIFTIKQAKESNKYQVLVIATAGGLTDEEETIWAIQKASNFPISIICIGIGDGPWDTLKDFNERIKGRQFDNFHFCSFHEVVASATDRKTALAVNALMDVPEQYHAVQKLGLLEKSKTGIGVGDGPWDTLKDFHHIEGRQFDNFISVGFTKWSPQQIARLP